MMLQVKNTTNSTTLCYVTWRLGVKCKKDPQKTHACLYKKCQQKTHTCLYDKESRCGVGLDDIFYWPQVKVAATSFILPN